jgi:hypothetical protein
MAVDMDKLRDTMITNLKRKPDVSDLDNFMNRLENKKADAATVQNLVGDLKQEIILQIKNLKKEETAKSKKKAIKTKEDQESSTLKVLEEARVNKDKITKLAA